MKTAYDIILRPIITEQSMEDLDIKKYAFAVAKDANKIEIKKAIEEIFDVKVIKVTTENVDGKMKRTGAYPMGRTASWKKAVVKLSADSKNIELFEGARRRTSSRRTSASTRRCATTWPLRSRRRGRQATPRRCSDAGARCATSTLATRLRARRRSATR